ncbi:hypothetical protein EJB05_30725, partial [Eragrostis curvula]
MKSKVLRSAEVLLLRIGLIDLRFEHTDVIPPLCFAWIKFFLMATKCVCSLGNKWFHEVLLCKNSTQKGKVQKHDEHPRDVFRVCNLVTNVGETPVHEIAL